MKFQEWFEKEYPYIGRKYELGANDLEDAFVAGKRAGLAEAAEIANNVVNHGSSYDGVTAIVIRNAIATLEKKT